MSSDRMKIYRKGDICPFCGMPIQTDDPFTLGLITGYAAKLLGDLPKPGPKTIRNDEL